MKDHDDSKSLFGIICILGRKEVGLQTWSVALCTKPSSQHTMKLAEDWGNQKKYNTCVNMLIIFIVIL